MKLNALLAAIGLNTTSELPPQEKAMPLGRSPTDDGQQQQRIRDRWSYRVATRSDVNFSYGEMAVREFRRAGISVGLLTLPVSTSVQRTGSSFIQRRDLLVTHLADRYGCWTLAPKVTDDGLFTDGVHLDARGREIVTEQIVSKVVEQLE